jgi:hypothetical protein
MKLLISILLAATAACAQSSMAGTWTLQGNTGTAQAALVSVSVTPGSPTQSSGSGVAFTATGTFSDGTTQDVTSAAIWSSSNTGVALVDTPADPQNVNCISAGSSIVGAVLGGVSGTAALTCSAISSSENAYCTGSTDATCFATIQNDGPAALPTSGMETDMANTPASGTSATVAAGSCSAIQTALNNASCGQTVIVPALNGSAQNTQTCNITLPAHSCDAGHWIWLVSDQLSNSNFPAEHTRATPCAINHAAMSGYPGYPCITAATLMPQIQCANSGNQACITAAAGANYYRIIGFDILQSNTFSNDGNGLVDLTGGADHIIIDRSMLHGQAVSCTLSGSNYSCSSKDLKNGVQLQNSTNVAVINSWLYDIACPEGTCTDSHAFGGGNGTSASHTYKIYNNLISAAGENFFQGGGGSVGSTAIVTPTDFEIRNNQFFKPVSYALCTGCNGEHVEFKNLFEIKNGQRLLIEGNEFENDWMGWQTDQSGYALVIGARNQNSSVFLTASSDGAGNLTATSGSFGTIAASPVSSLCATAGHCKVTVGGTITNAQTQTDSTHISVSPAPAAGSGIAINQCTPGLNPNAIATDITIRFNEFRNSTNGPEFATVLSDCGDPSLGLTRFTLHDNLIQGINSDLNNSSSGNALARCTYVLNAEPATITNYVIEHNTCAMGRSGSFGYSGFDATQDLTDTTIDGSNGAYIANRTIQNNLGPAGGILTYSSGLYPGGALAGLKQQSCTPPVSGTACTWTYTRNVLGVGQWTNQINNTPFPSTNFTCNASSATCFPSGTAFTNLFVSYNGTSGQPGYLGDYHLATGNPYVAAGTDGKDIGADIATLLTKVAGVRSDTSYTVASITTASLPNATHGSGYSTQLSATSASDMQVWRVTSGTLPSGLSLSFAGLLSGTPASAGTSSFTVQMMDAAQQYDNKALSLTVQ